MNIVLFGASGFIGSRVAKILRAHGHTLRTPSRSEFDYLQPNEAAARSILNGADAVFNCIGVMSRDEHVLETVHHHTPAMLAKIAVEQGVQHWVQLSALGADPKHSVAFVGSKGRGDEAVCQIGAAHRMRVLLARPSLVYGRGGTSCELFIRLARLPLIALPNGGYFDVQPVHVADVAQGLANLLTSSLPHGTVLNMTGSRSLTLAQYLSILRQTLHRKPAQHVLPIPLPLLHPMLPLAKLFSNGIVSPDSFTLLQQGSCADSQAFAELLGRPPLSVEQFAAAEDIGA
ncbi:NAD-dependent epimerase/dehydratase family protein [Eikenella corrodens]|uniref:NAD-dependent epimerase/dehydratase family protein n=1 Tax=Eikenella corrodens TaxID=539 RepID=UPI00129B98B0|nr:NAD-dependent epimerase/dehydratase family protein [Eikenella corrodens]